MLSHQQVQLLLYEESFQAVRNRNIDKARVNIPRITDVTVLNELVLLALEKNGLASIEVLALLMQQGATNHWSALAKLQNPSIASKWQGDDYEKAHLKIVAGIVSSSLLPENSIEKHDEAFNVVSHMMAKGRNAEVKRLLSLSGIREVLSFDLVLQEALRVKNADVAYWLTQQGVQEIGQSLVFLQQHVSRYFWMQGSNYDAAHAALVNTLARNGIQSQRPDTEKKAVLCAIQVLIITGQNEAIQLLLSHGDIQKLVADTELRGENPSLLRCALQAGNGVGAAELSKFLKIVDIIDGLRCLEHDNRWVWQSGNLEEVTGNLLTAIPRIKKRFPKDIQSNLKAALSYLIKHQSNQEQKIVDVLDHVLVVQCLQAELGDLLIDAVQWARSKIVLKLAGKGEIPKPKGDQAFSIADGRRRAYFWQRQESNIVGSFWDNRFRPRISDEAYDRLKDRYESTYTLLLSPVPRGDGDNDSDWDLMSDTASVRSSATVPVVDEGFNIQRDGEESDKNRIR